ALNIARWDGKQWESVGDGLNGIVTALCVFDEDGVGPKAPALFAGGGFSAATFGTVQARGIARWDGSEWSPVGATLNVGSIFAMAAWDQDGKGPAKPSLY